jgi:hypothetical protein
VTGERNRVDWIRFLLPVYISSPDRRWGLLKGPTLIQRAELVLDVGVVYRQNDKFDGLCVGIDTKVCMYICTV